MHSIFSYWSFDYITTAFIVLLCFAYLYIINFKIKKQSAYFFAGIILLIICIDSPLHFLGENYLFSAHMLSHTLIILIVAPLLIAGIPTENKCKNSFISFSKKISKAPFICWLIGVSIMWFWHIPSIFNNMFMINMQSSSHTMNLLSYTHMFSLLLAGMLFCLPVINPYSTYKLSSLKSVLYLTSACVFCSLLGLLITFAPVGTYTHYININDAYNLLPTIRNSWNISTATDQQAGGLIMWVPCCFIYLTASMILLIKWFDEKKIIVDNNSNQHYELGLKPNG
ncbi:MAG: cytochrome c oxidase assembly protein [Parafilimonas sp.]